MEHENQGIDMAGTGACSMQRSSRRFFSHASLRQASESMQVADKRSRQTASLAFSIGFRYGLSSH
jgi:hypothetical protein